MPAVLENYPQFFTATILEWKPLLKPDKYKDIVIQSLQYLVDQKRTTIYGFVIMPNHIHLIWQIAPGHKREIIQRDLLGYTGKMFKEDLERYHPKVLERFRVQTKDRAYQIWERNALSIDLYNEKVLLQKMEYLHNNPLQEKWKLCCLPEKYIYSSAAFYYTGVKNYDFLSHYLG